MKNPSRSELAGAVIPALSRNPFSSTDGIGHVPPFPPRGYRIQALRGSEVVAAPPPGEKSKWIPTFAGMTNKGRGPHVYGPYGSAPTPE